MVADNRNVFVTMTLRDQMTGKVKKIQGSLADTRAALDKTAGRVKRTETSFATLTGNVLKAAPAFAVATAAITAAYQSMRLLREEFIGGLKAVEDYNIRVASMAGFITQFSRKGAEGNLVEAFQEANTYAGQLVEKLEIIDAKTIATGKDLSIMAETFLKNGQLLDIYNEKQIEGFVNIANALKLVTQGQNQEIQMRQEINALMKGQLRPTDQLGKLLQKINPDIKEQLRLWADQGVVIERVGEMLFGMKAAGESIEATWEAVGTSLKTIHDRVLRDAFRPTYENLIELAIELRDKFVDVNGELTETGKTLQGDIKVFLEDASVIIGDIYAISRKVVFLFNNLSEYVSFIYGGFGIIRDFSVEIARDTVTIVDSWIKADPVLEEIERRYKNIERYANAIAEMEKPAELAEKPFFTGFDIAGEIGLGREGKAPEIAKTIKLLENEEKILALNFAKDKRRDQVKYDTQKEFEKQQKRLAKINDEYAKDVQKAWEDVTLAILPEHERKVESVIRKYDKLREQALVMYGDDSDFAQLEENLKLLNTRQEEQIDKLKETNEVAKDLGFTFASAFEDAIVAGGDLRDILEGLLDDITRIIVRMSVTEPMADWLTNTLSGISFGGSSTGAGVVGENTLTYTAGKAFGGSVFAGETYKVGENGPELLHMGSSGSITPNGQGGGGNTYININAVDTRSFNDAMKRNPGSVISIINDAVQAGDMGLRSALRAGVR